MCMGVCLCVSVCACVSVCRWPTVEQGEGKGSDEFHLVQGGVITVFLIIHGWCPLYTTFTNGRQDYGGQSHINAYEK